MATSRVSTRSPKRRRRSTSARRSAVPPAREVSSIGGSFKQLLGLLGAASASLEQSRRPMRKR